MKNESCITGMLFCRKCKMLRWNVYDTYGSSSYKFLCEKCAKEEEIISSCKSCGREGVTSELLKHGGYCHKCENDNIIECDLCGAEVYSQNSIDNICNKCSTGVNKQCLKCGSYINSSKLNDEGICEKCTIKIYKQLKDSNVDEVVGCIECGREALVSDLNEGLCIYCYSHELENEIKRINNKIRKRKSYNY